MASYYPVITLFRVLQVVVTGVFCRACFWSQDSTCAVSRCFDLFYLNQEVICLCARSWWQNVRRYHVFRADLAFQWSFSVPTAVHLLRINAAAQHVTRLDALFAATVASVNSAATQRGQRWKVNGVTNTGGVGRYGASRKQETATTFPRKFFRHK